MLKFIREHIIFLVIFSITIILRLIPLFNYQFTSDEISALDRTQFQSFNELINRGVKIDAHPALVQVLFYYLSKCFGYVTWIIKLPFLLFSFGAIIYAYFFGYKNFSKHVGIIACLIFSFSLVFVYYAPIARMYISGVFFSIALLYYFFEIFFSNNYKKINYFLFGLFALLSALNQHINALFAFTVCVSGLFFISKNNYKKFLISCACIVLAYSPNLPITLYQLSIGGIGFEEGGWLPKPNIAIIFDFIKILLGTGKSYLIFLTLMMLTFILNRRFIFNRKQIYLLVIFVVNFLIVYFYSVFRASIYQHSVMLFSGVTFAILCSTLLNLKNRYGFLICCSVIVSLFFYKTYYKKNYFQQCVANIYEYQFKQTIELKKKYGNALVYPFYFDCDTFTRKIYFRTYNTNFDCKITADSATFSIAKFSKFVSALNVNYIALASSFPTEQAITQQYFPYLIENTQTQGLNFKVYSKLKSDEKKCAEEDVVLNQASVFNTGNYRFSTSNLPLKIDSLNQFPFNAKAALNKVTKNEGEIIRVKAKIKVNNFNFNGVGLCISINETKKDSCLGYSATESSNFIINPDSTITLYCSSFCGSNYYTQKDISNINAYIWNRGKQSFTLLNFEIKTIDFWSEKWNYWK